MNTKVIPSEQLHGIDDWTLPDISDPQARDDAASHMTARQLEELQREARAEGFAQGRREGLAAGQKEIRARVHELNHLMQTLARPLEQLDETVEQELVDLVVLIARQLIRRELRTEPGEILAVIREAMALLPLAATNVRLLLHPEDAELVRTNLSMNSEEQAWKVVEDPVIARGGCKVISDTSQIDATVENRLNAVISRLLGGERADDAEQ
ncbi:flagellar assembly protein FliH [Thiohalobacter thiocyanaticus]|uniref:Flagellar assembly protein FliH n=1 Tax=Thiohalobacter thiocyanaticus TaxID=585455 RepID=A0A426QGP1_9GAMM|nr:flagellar assembly protein FliH [Thiohalobacter thiocyanaticus]RRQ20921.1 flagellar assembly protein FliH [Thiohalobacter thiocyanaticus]